MSRPVLLGAAVAAVLAVGVPIGLLTADGRSPGGAVRVGVPTLVGADALPAVAVQAGRPVFWAGSAFGDRLEVTRTARGATFVRYLAGDVRAGDARAAFVTVATYAAPDARDRVRRAARRPGAKSRTVPGGAFATWASATATSVYLAPRTGAVLVEVFSPDPAQARAIVLSGAITPAR